MGRGKSYKPYATTLKSYLCNKYARWKRKENKYMNCIECPAYDPEAETCYMKRIINSFWRKK